MLREWFRIPLVQWAVAFVVATCFSGCGYYVAASAVMRDAMRRFPHDGQAGLGALAAGLMVVVVVWPASYFSARRLLAVWERRAALVEDGR